MNIICDMHVYDSVPIFEIMLN